MIDNQQIEKLYQVYPALSGLPSELVTSALAHARLVTLEAGRTIFEELHPCQAFPFILSGTIRVFKQSVNGRELTLYHVTSGDVCVVTAGCLLGHEPYQASGVVKADSTLLMIDSNDFDNLLTSKDFREFVFSLLSQRILGLMQLVEEVAFQKLDQRLAALLLQRGPRLHLSHQTLADELGTVREIITRLLNSFADSRIITLGRNQIEILDESALKMMIQN